MMRPYLSDEVLPVCNEALPVCDEALPVYDEDELVQAVGQGERWLEVHDDVSVVGLLAAQTGSVAHAQRQHQRLRHVRHALVVLKPHAPATLHANYFS